MDWWPEIREEPALLTARILAAIGGGLAFVTGFLSFTDARFLSAPILALTLLVIAAAAVVLGAREVSDAPKRRRRGARGLDVRFNRNLYLSAYTLGLYALFFFLGLIAVGSLFSAVGVFGSFTLGAAIVENHLVVFLAIAAGAIAGAIPVAAHLPALHRLDDGRHKATLITAGFLAVSAILGTVPAVTDLVGAAAGATALLVASVCLFLIVHWNARLPALQHILEWLETDDRVRRSNLPKVLVLGVGILAGVLALIAATSPFTPVTPQLATILLGISFGAIMIATFGVGITPVETRFEYGAAELEEARKRRILTLHGLTYSLTTLAVLLGIVGLVTAISAMADIPFVNGFAEGYVLGYHFYLALVVMGLAVAVALRSFVRTDRRFTDELMAISFLMASATGLLMVLAVLTGGSFVSGAWVGHDVAAILFTAAAVTLIVFIKTRTALPSVVSLLKAEMERTRRADEETKEVIRKQMIWTYVLSFAFLLLFMGFVAASFAGLIKLPEAGPERDMTIFGWLVGGLLVLVMVVLRYFQTANIDREYKKAEKRHDIGRKRLTAEEFTRYLVLGASMSVAAVLLVLGVLVFSGKLTSLGPLELDKKYATDFFVFALLVGLGPYGWYHNRELKRIQAIDQKFPEFLRDLAESQRAGMTLTEAVVTASKGTYGALTWDIRKMAAQVEWGVPFTEALERFARRVRTPLIERTVSLIVQAANAGGNVTDVLTSAADDSREVQLIIKERRGSMQIYTMIIYVAFLVFLAVIAILNAQFIPEVSKAVRGAEGVSFGGLSFKAFDEAEFQMLFFHAAVIQAMGGGLVAGVMEGGKPVAGLRHAFILITIAYVLFRFVIGG